MTPLVDVRDMLCAQALAVVAQALGQLRFGERLEVRSDAEDVHRDLLSWAADRGHVATEVGDGLLRIERRHAASGQSSVVSESLVEDPGKTNKNLLSASGTE